MLSLQLLPSTTGQGAVNAMQDAVILANCLYEIQPKSHENIQKCFQSFRKQRYDYVKASYEASQNAAKLKYGHVSWTSDYIHTLFRVTLHDTALTLPS